MGSTITPGFQIDDIMQDYADIAQGGLAGIYRTPHHSATIPGIVELWFIAKEEAMRNKTAPRLVVVRCERDAHGSSVEWDYKDIGITAGAHYYGAPWEMVKQEIGRIEAQNGADYSAAWLARWHEKNEMRYTGASGKPIAVGPRVAAL